MIWKTRQKPKEKPEKPMVAVVLSGEVGVV